MTAGAVGLAATSGAASGDEIYTAGDRVRKAVRTAAPRDDTCGTIRDHWVRGCATVISTGFCSNGDYWVYVDTDDGNSASGWVAADEVTTSVTCD